MFRGPSLCTLLQLHMLLIDIIVYFCDIFSLLKKFYVEQPHKECGEGWVENEEVVLGNQRFQLRRMKLMMRHTFSDQKELVSNYGPLVMLTDISHMSLTNHKVFFTL